MDGAPRRLTSVRPGGNRADRLRKTSRLVPGRGRAAAIRGIVDDKLLLPPIHPLLHVIGFDLRWPWAVSRDPDARPRMPGGAPGGMIRKRVESRNTVRHRGGGTRDPHRQRARRDRFGEGQRAARRGSGGALRRHGQGQGHALRTRGTRTAGAQGDPGRRTGTRSVRRPCAAVSGAGPYACAAEGRPGRPRSRRPHAQGRTAGGGLLPAEA